MSNIKKFFIDLKNKLTVKSIVAYSITIICFLFCIGIAVEVVSASVKHRPPRFFGISISHVPTKSMEPTIMAGEYIMFAKTDFDDVNVDDIIIYRNSKDIYVVHRVIEKNDSFLITKGDNNLYEDENIYPDMVYGKYITTVGILSIFSNGINKGLVFFLLMFVLVIMIVMQIVSIVVKNKTEQINNNIENEKKKLLEQMRLEILQEELEKMKNEQKDKDA